MSNLLSMKADMVCSAPRRTQDCIVENLPCRLVCEQKWRLAKEPINTTLEKNENLRPRRDSYVKLTSFFLSV
ncbi:hypothetical protein JTE90_028556 [Oedothorax gibbosus]|uniref:Uncharacterized protein n=1 Tax=Oedothorax gibbosus TaxID=931172 RepID=A0AAV6VWB8_9ARAC|nr:hypothetical protein JTE90_028556 [Oedothorax gibbosus]